MKEALKDILSYLAPKEGSLGGYFLISKHTKMKAMRDIMK